MNEHDVTQMFNHHPPTSDAVVKNHAEMRAACLSLAIKIHRNTPGCADQTLAIRAVERAMFYANAAIARNQHDEVA